MSGADYQKRESKAVAAIRKAIPSSLKRNMLKQSAGLFAELYENKAVFPNHYCATACDGVGTKLILAEVMEKYDTIGQDLVAMNANDLATFGNMSPFMFINYIAVQAGIQEKGLTKEIIKGMVAGLEQCDAGNILRSDIHVQMGKGETASVDEMLSSVRPGTGFDVAGMMIGFIPKKKLVTKVSVGDKIIALKSSGPHSNGYTDLRLKLLKGEFEQRKVYRKRYIGKFGLDDSFDGSTIGKILLEPTKLYVRVMAAVSKAFDVVGVNNTGYGLKNFNRYTGKHQFVISDPMLPQPIFSLMQDASGFTHKQMYQKFNMGMGFFIVCDKDDADAVLSICEKQAHEAKVVGSVKKAKTVSTVLEKNNKKIEFAGY